MSEWLSNKDLTQAEGFPRLGNVTDSMKLFKHFGQRHSVTWAVHAAWKTIRNLCSVLNLFSNIRLGVCVCVCSNVNYKRSRQCSPFEVCSRRDSSVNPYSASGEHASGPAVSFLLGKKKYSVIPASRRVFQFDFYSWWEHNSIQVWTRILLVEWTYRLLLTVRCSKTASQRRLKAAELASTAHMTPFFNIFVVRAA